MQNDYRSNFDAKMRKTTFIPRAHTKQSNPIFCLDNRPRLPAHQQTAKRRTVLRDMRHGHLTVC